MILKYQTRRDGFYMPRLCNFWSPITCVGVLCESPVLSMAHHYGVLSVDVSICCMSETNLANQSILDFRDDRRSNLYLKKKETPTRIPFPPPPTPQANK